MSYRAKLLVTCQHGFPRCPDGLTPNGLKWKRACDGQEVDLSGSRVLMRDEHEDILIILSRDTLVPLEDVADLPPRRLFKNQTSIQFHGVGQYAEGVDIVWHEPDSGIGTIVGSGGPTGDLVKFQSENVTPGFSGSALICETDVGLHVVGMITGRYNAEGRTNGATAWAVEPGRLRTAIQVAAQFAGASNPGDPSLTWAPDLDVAGLQAVFDQNIPSILDVLAPGTQGPGNTVLSNLADYSREQGNEASTT